MDKLVMLTTVDNPYDPFTHWDEWYAFDSVNKYYTLDYLARVQRTSDELSDADQTVAWVAAIDEIIAEDTEGFYKKVTVPAMVSASS